MILFSVILFAAAILLLSVGAAVYRGRTDLIHDYHQQNVKEEQRPAYGRAIAAGLFSVGGTLIAGGVIGLFGDKGIWPKLSLTVLFIGLAVSIAIFVRAQKKYNNGIF